MSEGEVTDEVTGNIFPDPLSLNYLNIKLTDRPVSMTLSEGEVTHFWSTSYEVYGACHLDDIVLTLNGVPHYNLLKRGDVIYFPSEKDIKRSFVKERGR